jgi:hypothetical protein
MAAHGVAVEKAAGFLARPSIFNRPTLRVCTKSSNGGLRRKRCCVLSSPKGAETEAMLFWALLASGQISMRKVDGYYGINRNLER